MSETAHAHTCLSRSMKQMEKQPLNSLHGVKMKEQKNKSVTWLVLLSIITAFDVLMGDPPEYKNV